jgi:hypothetical protein
MQFFEDPLYNLEVKSLVYCVHAKSEPTILEKTITSHHYLWITLAPFFKELK